MGLARASLAQSWQTEARGSGHFGLDREEVCAGWRTGRVAVVASRGGERR